MSTPRELLLREAFGPSDCCAAPAAPLRRKVTGGGLQIRAYCTRCWHCGRALPQAALREAGVDVDALPLADHELLERAQRSAQGVNDGDGQWPLI